MLDIDINLYDRQVRTYGLDAIKKISSSSVLIIGLENGLATEVGKNLALGGIKNIYLYDTFNIKETDLENGFYYSVDSIGKPRSDVLANKLQELNPYVTVESVNDWDKNQNVTIIINKSIEFIKQISNYCRSNNSKLVVLFSKGMAGVIFVDAGISHIITDITSEIIEPVQIGEITNDGIVHCAQNSSHDFQSGDYITFSNLEGTNLEQFVNQEYLIKIINKTSFKIDNFNYNNFVFINGTATIVKKPITINHEPFDIQIQNPKITTLDNDYSNKLINTFIKVFSNEFDVEILQQLKLFNYEFMPVVSIMGSLTASETIKLVTNKYTPINQWFTWTDTNLLPNEDNTNLIYNQDFKNKLLNSKWLIVGSGAIGCELLKNLAYIGIKNIIITDPDTIEKSNLNRQFLFRSQHIGQFKSEIAANEIKKMIPDLNIISERHKVGSDNLNFTNDIMTNNITGVFNALDNINARRFMDEQCFRYNLPLFESGTTGTKGNTQPVIPFITETYSATSDPEQDKNYPMCTIKSFPNEIHHTIHWAMDQFEFFNRAPINMNKWILNDNYLETLEQTERNVAIEDINTYTRYTTQIEIYNCVKLAVDMFVENYKYSIIKLLETFKPDHEVSPGVLFWSGGKKCPKPIDIDHNNEMHINYIETTTYLLAITSGIEYNITKNEIIQLIKEYNSEIIVKKDIIQAERINYQPIYINQDFDKDDETKRHIEWINAASNLRAINYGIPIVDKQYTKGIAGKIIPAIATTTSIVSGLIVLEMMKYILGHNKVDNYKSSFINLADPIIISSDPINAPLIDIAGMKINSWTKFEYTKNTTLLEFKQYYENIFKTNITMIVIDTNMVYADFLGDDSLNKLLSDIILETENVSNNDITFTILTDDDKEIPTINVKL